MPVAVPTYGSPVTNSSGQTVGVAAFNPNTGQPLAGAGNFNPNTGQAFSSNSGLVAPQVPPSAQDAASLTTPTSSLTVPPPQTGTNSNSFVNSLIGGINGGTNNSSDPSGSNTNTNSNNSGSTFDWRNNFKAAYLGLTQEAGTEGDVFNSLNEKYQVPEITQQLAGVRGTIAQRTAAYMSQWQQANSEHAALPYIAGEQTQIQRTQAIEIGMLTAQEQALSGNLQAAQDIVDQTIKHQFDPIKTQLTSLQNFYQMNQNDLTDSEKAQLTQNYNIQTIQYQDLLSTQKDAVNTAIQYGRSDLLGSLAGAKTKQEIWNIMSGVVNGTSPSVTDITGSPTSSSPTSAVVGGYDWSKYAVNNDGTTNMQSVGAMQVFYNKIGTITSVQGAQDAITKLFPNSPITGAMIEAAATQYGVDPTALIARMAVETQCGTDGSKGSKECNYGNVGNTNSVMASGKSVAMGTPQLGVNAVAQWMANHKASISSTVANPSGTPTQSGTDFHSLQASAPPMISAPGILNQLASTGSAYIDLSKLPNGTEIMATNWAKQHNVALLNSDQVKNAVATDEAIRNITDVIAPAWDQISYNGRGGQLVGKITEPFGMLGDTNTYSLNKTFSANRESLAQQIKALSGSAPRLGLLGTAKDALPDNSGYGSGFLVSLTPWGGKFFGDTYQDGVNKMNRTLQLLNESISSYIPGDKGVALLPTTRGGTPTSTNTAPQKGQTQLYQGANYNFDGTQWVKQ